MCQERAGFGLWFLPLTALCECSTEQCCGAVCSYRRTRGLSHLCESACTLWSCGLTGSSLSPWLSRFWGLSHSPGCLYRCGGSQAPLSPQVVPWLSRFQSRQSRCTRHRSKRLHLVTAALTLPRPLPAEQILVTTLSAFLTSAESNSHQHAPCPLPGQFPSSGTFSQAY